MQFIGQQIGVSVVQPKRIRVVDDEGSHAFELGKRFMVVVIHAAMVEGTVGW